MRLTRTLLALAVPMAPVCAQPMPGTGHFETIAMGMVFESASGTPQRMSIKLPPFEGNPPSIIHPFPGNGPSRPDYRISVLQAAFNDALSLPNETPLVLDGMCSGNSVVPGSADSSTGLFTLADQWSQQWGAIFVGVKRGHAGNGWYLNGSDILAFYADQSLIPNILSGHTYREFEPSLAANLPGNIATPPDIQAFDVAMPNIWLTAPSGSTEWMPEINKFYFTVPKLHALIYYGGAALNYAPDNMPHGIDGTSIIRAEWLVESGFPQGHWTNFIIVLDHTDIDYLTADDDVDALAVGPAIDDRISYTISHVYDSTLASSVFDQLRIVSDFGFGTFLSGDIVRGPSGNGNKVIHSVGIQGTKDVDSVCWQDPEAGTHGALFATPFGPAGDFPLSVTHYTPLVSNATTGGVVFAGFSIPQVDSLIGTEMILNIKSEAPPSGTNPWGVFPWNKKTLNLGMVNVSDLKTIRRTQLPTGLGVMATLRVEFRNPNSSTVVSTSYESGFRWF